MGRKSKSGMTSSSTSGPAQANGTIVNGNRVYLDDDGFYRVESADGSWDGYEQYSSRSEALQAAMSSNDTELEDRGVGGSTVGSISVYMSGGSPVQGYKLSSSASKQDMLDVAREGEFHSSRGGASRSLVIDAGDGAVQHEARITEVGGRYQIMVSGKHGSYGGTIQTRKSAPAAERTARKMLEKQIDSTYDYESRTYLRR